MARARWSQAPDDDAAAMYVTAMERLDAAGYEQYEISNVARPGRRSRHNLKYWTDGEWLGFGCGAHSTRDGVRWKNVSGTEDYVDRVTQGVRPAVDVRRLTDARAARRRAVHGPAADGRRRLTAIERRYGVDVWQRYGPISQPYRRRRPANASDTTAATDPPGHAACPRSDGGFRVDVKKYAKVTPLLNLSSKEAVMFRSDCSPVAG